MDKNKRYFLYKDQKSKEISYIEFTSIDGLRISPKVGLDDNIKVNKIVFTSPNLSEKLLKKKLEIKIRYLSELLKEIEADDGDDDGTANKIRNTLVEAERLKLSLINKYIRYLGSEFRGLTLEKLEFIINRLRLKLYINLEKRKYLNERQNYEEERNENKGHKR